MNSSKTLKKISNDDFQSYEKAFTREIISIVANVLKNADLDLVTTKDSKDPHFINLLYSICFDTLINIDTDTGTKISTRTLIPEFLISDEACRNKLLYSDQRSFFHRHVDDPLIEEVVDQLTKDKP